MTFIHTWKLWLSIAFLLTAFSLPDDILAMPTDGQPIPWWMEKSISQGSSKLTPELELSTTASSSEESRRLETRNDASTTVQKEPTTNGKTMSPWFQTIRTLICISAVFLLGSFIGLLILSLCMCLAACIENCKVRFEFSSRNYWFKVRAFSIRSAVDRNEHLLAVIYKSSEPSLDGTPMITLESSSEGTDYEQMPQAEVLAGPLNQALFPAIFGTKVGQSSNNAHYRRISLTKMSLSCIVSFTDLNEAGEVGTDSGPVSEILPISPNYKQQSSMETSTVNIQMDREDSGEVDHYKVQPV